MDRYFSSFTRTKVFAILLISVVTWLIYYNSLTVPFYLDDIRSISNNSIIHAGSLKELYETFQLRFVAYLSFWVDYKIQGTTQTEYLIKQLHTSNILVHMLNGVFVFILTYLCAYKTPNSSLNLQNEHKNLILFPLLCALLFITHPLHSQAVTYIVQRTAALVSFFYLISLISYVWFRISKSHVQRILSFLFTLTFAFAAFFTKQNAYTLPIAIVLVELTFFNSVRVRHLILSLILFTASFIIAFIINEQGLIHLLTKLDSLTRENQLYTRFEYLVAQINILWVYIAKFFIPYQIHLEYDYQINSFSLAQTIVAMIGHITLISFAWLKRKKLPLIAFGVLFYYVAHLVESSIIPIKDLAFEHRTYLPNVGLIFVLLGILIKCQHKWKLSKSYMSFAFVIPIIVVFSTLTIYRNFQWQNPISFYEYELSLNPKSCRVLGNLAENYHKTGNNQKALSLMEKCILLNDNFYNQGEILNNYIVALISNKQYQRADEIAVLALKDVSDPVSRRRILENAGISKMNQRQLNEAIAYFKKAITLPNPYPNTYFALSLSLAKQKQYVEAKKYIEIGLSLEPSNKDAQIILTRLNKLINKS